MNNCRFTFPGLKVGIQVGLEGFGWLDIQSPFATGSPIECRLFYESEGKTLQNFKNRFDR